MGQPPPEPPPEDLSQLVARATAGDTPSLDALLLRYLPRLRAFVRVHSSQLVRQQESCSDLVQSVCREVLQGADRFQYRGDGPFRAWLFRTALNKILERTRGMTQQKRDVRRQVPIEGSVDYGDLLPAAGPTATQVAAASELRNQMEHAFDLLPDDYRDVIALSRIVGLTRPEIAQQTGRTEGSVRMLLSRALIAFVDAMDRVRAGTSQG